MDLSNVPENLASALRKILNEIEKSCAKKSEISIDFKEIKEGQEEYLKKIMNKYLEDIEQIFMKNYLITEPKDGLELLWARISTLELNMEEPIQTNTNYFSHRCDH